MPVGLGKRKRRAELSKEAEDRECSVDPYEPQDLQALFRRHFEAQFKPLPVTRSAPEIVAEIEEDPPGDESASGWEGLSGAEESLAELVQFSTSRTSKPEMSKEELKSFMSSKPPSSVKEKPSKEKKKTQNATDPEADTDTANLKKDLALQRLLKESHLFDSSSSLSHLGQNRHKALDMRLQDMGSTSSVFSQQKMPLAQRKGIHAKAAGREENRRKEALENGIVLEKLQKEKRRPGGRRERGIGAPSVGRFEGGTLKLSRKDVAEIEGPRKKTIGGKSGKR